MTRDWSFTLQNVGQWYNLWYDLIALDPSFDTYGATAPFIPSIVCQLEYQNQTPGAAVECSDSKKQQGFQLTGASWDIKSSNNNSIDLKNRNFKADTVNTVLYVAIISK